MIGFDLEIEYFNLLYKYIKKNPSMFLRHFKLQFTAASQKKILQKNNNKFFLLLFLNSSRKTN